MTGRPERTEDAGNTERTRRTGCAGLAGTGHAEAARTETGHAEAGHAEAGHAEAGHAGQVRRSRRAGEAVRGEREDRLRHPAPPSARRSLPRPARPRLPGRLRLPLGLLPAAVVVLLALVGPLLLPHPFDKPVSAPYAPPGPGLPLGGDRLGRDVFSRILAGGRDLLLTAGLVAVAVTALAAVLGALAAVRPRLGAVVERAADTLILLPAVLGIMVIGISAPGTGRWAVVPAAVVLGTPFAFRVAVSAAGPVAASGYVEAAKASGERTASLVFREVLPNLRTTLLALLGLRFVDAVNVVATAGFLEIGAQPPAADWALMVRENADGVLLNPWAVLVPGLALAVLAVNVNLALDVFAPRTRSGAVTRL